MISEPGFEDGAHESEIFATRFSGAGRPGINRRLRSVNRNQSSHARSYASGPVVSSLGVTWHLGTQDVLERNAAGLVLSALFRCSYWWRLVGGRIGILEHRRGPALDVSMQSGTQSDPASERAAARLDEYDAGWIS